MLTVEIIGNLTAIFIIFSIGTFIGSIWMFFSMNKSMKSMQKELDAKTHVINEFRAKEPFI